MPEIHVTCKVASSWIHIRDGISGTLMIEQCNMEIQSISVGVVQTEMLSEYIFSV